MQLQKENGINRLSAGEGWSSWMDEDLQSLASGSGLMQHGSSWKRQQGRSLEFVTEDTYYSSVVINKCPSGMVCRALEVRPPTWHLCRVIRE